MDPESGTSTAAEGQDSAKQQSLYTGIPLARRIQEGAWGNFQNRGRRSMERLKNRVSSRFMGRPVNLYIMILVVFFSIIGTIIYVELFLRPNWRNAEQDLIELIGDSTTFKPM
ncbi:uncharacterized protein LOC120328454 [Styela clava]|uniref:uncharacterized protein LOC120328454 n=1 Tax=Styela clava TaxID=7725 RepID=UPI00193929E3|nr:uncharacterized protein LOC120328454 [Styela clava]